MKVRSWNWHLQIKSLDSLVLRKPMVQKKILPSIKRCVSWLLGYQMLREFEGQEVYWRKMPMKG